MPENKTVKNTVLCLAMCVFTLFCLNSVCPAGEKKSEEDMSDAERLYRALQKGLKNGELTRSQSQKTKTGSDSEGPKYTPARAGDAQAQWSLGLATSKDRRLNTASKTVRQETYRWYYASAEQGYVNEEQIREALRRVQEWEKSHPDAYKKFPVNFGKIMVNYIKQRRDGGGPAGNIPGGWDRQRNCKL